MCLCMGGDLGEILGSGQGLLKMHRRLYLVSSTKSVRNAFPLVTWLGGGLCKPFCILSNTVPYLENGPPILSSSSSPHTGSWKHAFPCCKIPRRLHTSINYRRKTTLAPALIPPHTPPSRPKHTLSDSLVPLGLPKKVPGDKESLCVFFRLLNPQVAGSRG